MKWAPVLFLCLPCLAADVYSFNHKTKGEQERITALDTTNFNGQTFVYYVHDWAIDDTNRITGKQIWLQRTHMVNATNFGLIVFSRTNEHTLMRLSMTNLPVDRLKQAIPAHELQFFFRK